YRITSEKPLVRAALGFSFVSNKSPRLYLFRSRKLLPLKIGAISKLCLYFAIFIAYCCGSVASGLEALFEPEIGFSGRQASAESHVNMLPCGVGVSSIIHS